MALERFKKRIGLSKKTVKEVTETSAPIKRSDLIRSVSASLAPKQATLGEAKREERVPPGIPIGRLEQIYKLDGQIFGIINKFVRDIVGPGFIIETEDPETKKEVVFFCTKRDIGFMRMLQFAVRDCFIFGNAFFELVYNREKSDILQIIPIDPKTMDFQRDNLMYILRDKEGKPVGFEQTTATAEKIKFPRENIAHFTLYQLGDTELGMSPLEPAYKPVLYKLNVEDAIGEVYSKGAYPPILATVGDDKNFPTSEEMNKLEEDLKNISSRTAFILPHWIKLARMESGRLERVHPTEELNYFTSLIAGTLGAINPHKENFEDYERTVISLQRSLADQVELQLFARLVEAKGLEDIPNLKFTEITPAGKLAKARRTSILLRAGGLTWDEYFEQAIREEEGYPKLILPLEPEERARRSSIQKIRGR